MYAFCQVTPFKNATYPEKNWRGEIYVDLFSKRNELIKLFEWQFWTDLGVLLVYLWTNAMRPVGQIMRRDAFSDHFLMIFNWLNKIASILRYDWVRLLLLSIPNFHLMFALLPLFPNWCSSSLLMKKENQAFHLFSFIHPFPLFPYLFPFLPTFPSWFFPRQLYTPPGGKLGGRKIYPCT